MGKSKLKSYAPLLLLLIFLAVGYFGFQATSIIGMAIWAISGVLIGAAIKYSGKSKSAQKKRNMFALAGIAMFVVPMLFFGSYVIPGYGYSFWSNLFGDNGGTGDTNIYSATKPLTIEVKDRWAGTGVNIDSWKIYDAAFETNRESSTAAIGTDGIFTTAQTYESGEILWLELTEASQTTTYYQFKVPFLTIGQLDDTNIAIDAVRDTTVNSILLGSGKAFSFYLKPTITYTVWNQTIADLDSAEDPDFNSSESTPTIWYQFVSSVVQKGLMPRMYNPKQDEYWNNVFMIKLPNGGTEEEIIDLQTYGYSKIISTANDIYYYKVIDHLDYTFAKNAQEDVIHDGFALYTMTWKNFDQLTTAADFDMEVHLYQEFSVENFEENNGIIDSDADEVGTKLTVNIEY